jgi:hypothetical protein
MELLTTENISAIIVVLFFFYGVHAFIVDLKNMISKWVKVWYHLLF